MLNKISTLLFIIFLPVLLNSCASSSSNDFEFEPPVYPPPPNKPRFIWERTLSNSMDVKEETSMDRFKQFATGVGASAKGMAKPWGVAVYQGRVYVTDTVQRQVVVFDVPGKDFRIIGEEGPGSLTKPIGIATDKTTGTLYVSDITAKRVVVYDKDGNYLRAIGGRELLVRPTGVAVSPDGAHLWVIDNGGVDTESHHLHKFDAISGELLQTIGARGTAVGNFNLPMQVATGNDHTVYVVDAGNFRIQAFTPDGTVKKSFGAIGTKSGQFSRPKGIGIDLENNIYVVDASFGNFQIFNSAGELLLYIGDRDFSGGPASYVLPAGITVDEDGRVYVVDQFYRKVEVFRPADLPKEAGYLSSIRVKPVK